MVTAAELFDKLKDAKVQAIALSVSKGLNEVNGFDIKFDNGLHLCVIPSTYCGIEYLEIKVD